MTAQVGLNVVCQLRPGALEQIRAVLGEMAGRPGDNDLIPFGRVSGVHFARLVLLEATTDLQGQQIPDQLLLMADLDAPLEAHLAELVEVAGGGLDAVFRHCDGYPGPDAATPGLRLAFLQGHSVESDTFYANTIGRTVVQVRREAQLRDEIQAFLDAEAGWCDQEATRARARIQEFVRGSPELAWAIEPARDRDTAWILGELVWIVIVPLAVLAAAILLLPLVVLGLLVYVVLLRMHELRDQPSEEKPSPQHIAQLAAIEDHGPQNQFSAVGLIKPGPFRQLTARVVLLLTDYGTHHIFNHLSLAGVKTIHFARWVPLDGRRRMIFASNYDGSLESYMDDFVDKVAWGLNATFSNGDGYPKTDFLLFGGARDELAFKNFLRVRQVPTQVWYSAYDRLTVLNIENNAKIRAGLSGEMTAVDAARWLALL
jgi:hypothetical protein